MAPFACALGVPALRVPGLAPSQVGLRSAPGAPAVAVVRAERVAAAVDGTSVPARGLLESGGPLARAAGAPAAPGRVVQPDTAGQGAVPAGPRVVAAAGPCCARGRQRGAAQGGPGLHPSDYPLGYRLRPGCRCELRRGRGRRGCPALAVLRAPQPGRGRGGGRGRLPARGSPPGAGGPAACGAARTAGRRTGAPHPAHAAHAGLLPLGCFGRRGGGAGSPGCCCPVWPGCSGRRLLGCSGRRLLRLACSGRRLLRLGFSGRRTAALLDCVWRRAANEDLAGEGVQGGNCPRRPRPRRPVRSCPVCGDDLDSTWSERCGLCSLEVCWLCYWPEQNLCGDCIAGPTGARTATEVPQPGA